MDVYESIGLALVSAVAGGIVTFFPTRWSIRRSELRDREKSIEILIRGLESSGGEYWRKLPSDNDIVRLEAKIKSNIKQLGLEFSQLKHRGYNIFCTTSKFIEFHKSITEFPFESNSCYQSDKLRVDRISNAANDLIKVVRNALKII